jgi:hypothetical protein
VPTPPSFAASYSPSSDWTTAASPKTQTILANQGDLILVLGGTEDASTTLQAPSDGSNAYILEQAQQTASFAAAYAWAASVQAGALAITTSSLPAATSGTAYSATLTASGGSGYSWSIIAGSLPVWASLSSGGLISGTPSGSGTASFTVRVTDSAGDTATQPLSLTTAASGTAQPIGPGGTWTLVFEDTFPGTTLDTTKWATPNGINNSNTTTNPASVSVSGGYCRIVLAGMINSQPSLQGWGSNPASGPTFAVGDVVEASINFPGPSGDRAYNWPAWWTSGASWPANGECDIFESYNGTPSALNYHTNSGANNGPFPSGNWCNSFHTYTLVRGSSTYDCYWDGTLVRSVAKADSGGVHSLILYMASGNTANATAPMLVDYVRMWTP